MRTRFGWGRNDKKYFHVTSQQFHAASAHNLTIKPRAMLCWNPKRARTCGHIDNKNTFSPSLLTAPLCLIHTITPTSLSPRATVALLAWRSGCRLASNEFCGTIRAPGRNSWERTKHLRMGLAQRAQNESGPGVCGHVWLSSQEPNTRQTGALIKSSSKTIVCCLCAL